MNIQLTKPKAVIDAANAQKGLHWSLEMLIFLAVFIVCTIAQAIFVIPPTFIFLFTNEDYLNASMSGNFSEIFELSMKFATSNKMVLTTLFSTILMTGVVLLFCRLLQKRKMNTLGFVKRGWMKEYLIGLVVGFVIFSVAVGICVLTGSLEFHGISAAFTPGLLILFGIGFIIQGMAEEVLCRGYFMVSLARRYPLIAAILINSIWFMILHALNPGMSLLAIINLTLFGVFASLYFIKRGNIWGVCAIHSIWNFVQGNFYGISVSGMGDMTSVLQSTSVSGKELINGGTFGLEGGLAVTIVLVIGIAILTFYRKKDMIQNANISE